MMQPIYSRTGIRVDSYFQLASGLTACPRGEEREQVARRPVDACRHVLAVIEQTRVSRLLLDVGQFSSGSFCFSVARERRQRQGYYAGRIEERCEGCSRECERGATRDGCPTVPPLGWTMG